MRERTLMLLAVQLLALSASADCDVHMTSHRIAHQPIFLLTALLTSSRCVKKIT
jgi:hypothetical protein